MTTPANRMVASLLAAHLRAELGAAADGGCSCWLASASRVLHPNDLKKLRVAMQRRLDKLLKEADGCPPRIFDWREFFMAEDGDVGGS
ncbi:MAG: hypothetical protein HQL38_03110 [Alphaproteobacteria bacterium]|nr:hypothetical protein [Alphaproteobacteria bacterium]